MAMTMEWKKKTISISFFLLFTVQRYPRLKYVLFSIFDVRDYLIQYVVYFFSVLMLVSSTSIYFFFLLLPLLLRFFNINSTLIHKLKPKTAKNLNYTEVSYKRAKQNQIRIEGFFLQFASLKIESLFEDRFRNYYENYNNQKERTRKEDCEKSFKKPFNYFNSKFFC